jgi:hypothetical protein
MSEKDDINKMLEAAAKKGGGIQHRIAQQRRIVAKHPMGRGSGHTASALTAQAPAAPPASPPTRPPLGRTLKLSWP